MRERRNSYKILIKNSKMKIWLRRPMGKWEVNIKSTIRKWIVSLLIEFNWFRICSCKHEGRFLD